MDLTVPSYNYVTLEYERADDHQGSRSVTYGFCFEPFESADWFHVFGGWQDGKLYFPGGVRGYREGYLVGGGVKQWLNESSTIHARMGYVHSKTKIRGARLPFPPYTELGTVLVPTEGRYLEVGGRTVLRPRWELIGFASHVSAGGFIRRFLWLTLE